MPDPQTIATILTLIALLLIVACLGLAALGFLKLITLIDERMNAMSPQEVEQLVEQGVDAVKAHFDVAEQKQVAAAQRVANEVSELKSQIAALTEEVASLKTQAGPSADFSGVETKLTDLQAQADKLGTEAEAIAPAPAPASAGTTE